MAIHHAASGELIEVRQLGNEIMTTSTKALYKSNQLEVIHMILLAGKSMPSHQVDGDVSIQCIEGLVEFESEGHTVPMHAGGLICVAGGKPHALKAIENSALLVSIVLRSEKG